MSAIDQIRRIGMPLISSLAVVNAAAQTPSYGWQGLVSSDWTNPSNWAGGTNGPPLGTASPACVYITNGNGHALYYAATYGYTLLTNGSTTVGAGRVLRIADGNSATGALYIVGGTLETRGANNGDLLGNGANSFAMVVVDGGTWVSSTNVTMYFGNAGARAVLTVTGGGTTLVGTIEARNSTVGEINVSNAVLALTRLYLNGSMAVTVRLNNASVQSRFDHASWLPAGVTYSIGSGGVVFNAGNAVGITGTLSGDGGVTKVGSGTLTLGASNAFQGPTFVNAGTVVVGHNRALGSMDAGTVVAQGAILRLANGVTVEGELVTIAGNGDNFGALQAAGNATSVWNGPVVLNTGGAWGPRIGAGGNGVLTIAGPISSGTSPHLYISGSGGSGRVILSATNSYTGITGIIRGILQLGANHVMPTGTMLILNVAALSSDSSTFDLAGYSQTIAALGTPADSSQPTFVTNAASSMSVLTIHQTTNTTFHGVIGGNIQLVKQGTGWLTLAGVNAYSGSTIVNGGVLVGAASNALGFGNVVVQNGVLLLSTTQAVPGVVTVEATGAIGPRDPLSQAFLGWLASKIPGGVPVVALGSNSSEAVNFSGPLSSTFLGAVGFHTNTGAATWSDGNLRLGGGPGQLVYAAPISGSPTIFIGVQGGMASAEVVLPSGQTHSGRTVIQSGRLLIQADSSLGAVPGSPSTNITILNGTLVGPGSDVTVHGNRIIGVGTNAILSSQSGGILRIGGQIVDAPDTAGRVTIQGPGIVVLMGANTYSGGTVVPAGARLVISGNQAVGLGPLTLAGGMMRPAATAPAVTYVSNEVHITEHSQLGESNNKSLVLLGPVTLHNGDRRILVPGTDTATILGPIGDGGLGYGLVKMGSSRLSLGGTNTYLGPTIVGAGTLAIIGDGSIQSPMVVVSNGATLDVSGRTGGSMTLAAGQVLRGSGAIVGGLITGPGSTLAPGLSAGILTMNGALTMQSNSVFQVELFGLAAGIECDQLYMNSKALTLLSPTLQVELGYSPSLGDQFHIVTGLNNFDPAFDGTFNGLPHGGQFIVDGITFRIDYNSDDITLTVVPEPSTLSTVGVVCLLMVFTRRIRRDS